MELKDLPRSKRLKETTEAIIDTVPKDYLNGLYIMSLFNDGVEYQLCSQLIPNSKEFLIYCLSRGILCSRDSKIFFNSDILLKCLITRLTKKSRQEYHLQIANALKQHLNQLEN